jgi:oligopeptide/dipeptide ABC transporter ATP-binding protein
VNEPPLVSVRDVSVDFRVAARSWRSGGQRLRAVNRVSFDLDRGETLALVGESGSGKTTVGRSLLRLYDPIEGTIEFDGIDVGALRGSELLAFRRRIQMIFQDPYASLNPRMKVGDAIAEPLRAHRWGSREQRRDRIAELLGLVGLPSSAASAFPHAFSGGQRQRIGIARALALAPEVIVADEPVSALDVSIQAQIVNLLKDLQEGLGLALLFIAHDLAVVRQIAHRVAVMYLGRIVEIGERDAIFESPQHPYTQSLLAAVPIPDPPLERARERVVLRGEIPSPITPPSGCRFHTRCPLAMEICGEVEPQLLPTQGGSAACHLIHPVAAPTRQEVTA